MTQARQAGTSVPARERVGEFVREFVREVVREVVGELVMSIP